MLSPVAACSWRSLHVACGSGERLARAAVCPARIFSGCRPQQACLRWRLAASTPSQTHSRRLRIHHVSGACVAIRAPGMCGRCQVALAEVSLWRTAAAAYVCHRTAVRKKHPMLRHAWRAGDSGPHETATSSHRRMMAAIGGLKSAHDVCSRGVIREARIVSRGAEQGACLIMEKAIGGPPLSSMIHWLSMQSGTAFSTRYVADVHVTQRNGHGYGSHALPAAAGCPIPFDMHEVRQVSARRCSRALAWHPLDAARLSGSAVSVGLPTACHPPARSATASDRRTQRPRRPDQSQWAPHRSTPPLAPSHPTPRPLPPSTLCFLLFTAAVELERLASTCAELYAKAGTVT